MKEPRIVFMGTPEFAVASLKGLVDAGKNIVGVITVPDKPAGRGQQLQQSAVKKFATEIGLKVLQPEKLKDPQFLEELRALQADLQIVVAFRMLPEVVWRMPPMGTFNLHGSLLPQYRGAAPINWAVINGESKTGVTTFFLDKEIDTGKILFKKEITIGPEETAGEVHDRLMEIGAQLVIETVDAITNGAIKPVDQSEFFNKPEELKHAPKIFRETCKVDWNRPATEVHNLIRGLSPYPAAFTEIITSEGVRHQLKIFRSEIVSKHGTPGSLSVPNGKELIIYCGKDALKLLDLQISGKKRMPTADFLRGFSIAESWKAE